MKRSFDIIVSLLMLVLLWPLFLVIYIAIIVDSPGGSALYRQKRIGLNGKEFDILKFLSMVENADKIGSYQTSYADERVTRVGSFLRRTSLDELPQLVNVLKGDMSIVGPRPDVPAQRKLYSDAEWSKRTSVRPGITGLAQATLRSAAIPDQRVALDLNYVEQASLLFGLKVLLLTVRQVLGKGSF